MDALCGEMPPVGLILCTEKDEAVVHYALGGLNNKVFASQYKLQLPDPEILKREIEVERRRLELSAKDRIASKAALAGGGSTARQTEAYINL
jgi:hypothetical protein